jgi:hypothetical protein
MMTSATPMLICSSCLPARAPRGRKHDFKDAERLVRRLIADELILSFVPDIVSLLRNHVQKKDCSRNDPRNEREPARHMHVSNPGNYETGNDVRSKRGFAISQYVDAISTVAE